LIVRKRGTNALLQMEKTLSDSGLLERGSGYHPKKGNGTQGKEKKKVQRDVKKTE